MGPDRTERMAQAPEQTKPDSPLGRAVVRDSTPMDEALRVLDRGRLGILVVVDDAARLVGTLTDGDFRRAILAGHPFEGTIGAFAIEKRNPVYPEPVWLPATSTREQRLAVMRERKIRHVPLLDDARRVVDLVCLDDLAPGGTQAEPMTAVIMAGGLGMRLRPLTEHTPKPMLPVGGKPLLERTIATLRDSGIGEVVVSTRYKSEHVENHFQDGSEFGVRVRYLNEQQPMGTAGALRLLDRPASTVLVLNGDVLTSVDYDAMRAFHAEHDAILTVGVRTYAFSVPYGVVDCHGARVRGLREKPTFTSFVNAGIYLLEPDAFAFLPETDEAFNMTDLIGALVEAGEMVVSFPIHEYWMDIGQPEDYQAAQRDVASGLAG